MNEIDGVEADFRGKMSYGDYLRLPRSCSARRRR